MPAYDRSLSAPPAQVTGHRARNEKSHDQRVDRRHERSDARVHDTRSQKELERIAGNPEQVEQKRHGGVEAAEERDKPGERQLGIV